MILVIKHIDIEGPGSIGEFFRKTSRSLQVINLHKGETLPKESRDIEAVISLGGPMNVYEEEKFPFLKQEDEFLSSAVKNEIPILGICLGAQLLAKACKAKVKKAATKEIGWYKVSLTHSGRLDPIFNGLPAQLQVFQWHEDTFELPKGAVHLAESQACRNQAFRFGRNAYGLQFHVEVDSRIIESWIASYGSEVKIETQPKDILKFKKQAEILYHNFAGIINNSQKMKAG